MASEESVLRELGALATALGPALRPPGNDALLQSLVGTARAMFGAAACSLALLSEDEAELLYVAADGAGAASTIGLRLPSDAGLVGYVVQSGQPMVVNDLAQDARFARDVAERTGYVPTAMLLVPVASPREIFGVLSVLDRDTGRPGAENDLTALSLFADQAAVSLESVRTFGRLGAVLLRAVAEAAEVEGDLAAAALRAADQVAPADTDLGELAAAFADLARAGAAERRLAIAVLRDITGYVRGSTARRTPRTR